METKDFSDLIIGIAFMMISLLIFYYQYVDKQYKKGVQITDAQVKISYAGILFMILGIIFLFEYFNG